MVGVRRIEHEDGYTGLTVDQHFEIDSGSAAVDEVGPALLRGTFQVGMRTFDSSATLQITDGRIDVKYNPTPPPPGQSHRPSECLVRLAAGEDVECN